MSEKVDTRLVKRKKRIKRGCPDGAVSFLFLIGRGVGQNGYETSGDLTAFDGVADRFI